MPFMNFKTQKKVKFDDEKLSEIADKIRKQNK